MIVSFFFTFILVPFLLTWHKKMKLKLLTLSILFSTAVAAAPNYDITKSYPEGEKVTFEGDIFQSQWWANAGQSPADVTDSAWESPWLAVEQADIPAKNETAIVHYFDRVARLGAHALNETYLNVSAVETTNELAYIAQSNSIGAVKILDTKSGALLSQITGPGLDLPDYTKIEDLYIQDDLLFVAGNSQTVDVYNTNNHELIMSLGTNKTSGDNALNKTKSIVSNDDYLFVLDSTNDIKVYRQGVVTEQNHLKAEQTATLHIPSAGTYRSAQMEVLGNYLLISEYDSYSYLYDLTELENAITYNYALEPIKTLELWAEKISKSGDNLLFHKDGEITWFNIDQLIEEGFTFEHSQGSVTSLNGYPIALLRDLHASNNVLITADESYVYIDTNLSVEIDFTPNTSVENTNIQFDNIEPSSISNILSNDALHVQVVGSDYSYKVNSPVKTEFDHTRGIKFTNYSGLEMKDIKVELKHKAMDKWFTVATIDKIPAFTRINLSLEDLGKQELTFNTSEQKGVIDFTALHASPAFDLKDFDYRFSSETDNIAQKIANLKPDWKIDFWDIIHFLNPELNLDPNCQSEWEYISSLYAKEWTAMITNLAYIVSQDEFQHVWFNFKSVYGYDLNGKAGAVEGQDGFFTTEDYQHWFDALINRENISVGVTRKVWEDGNRLAMGVHTESFYSHYYGNWRAIARAFGKGFDGKHTFRNESNHSFVNYNGWTQLIDDLANYHIRKGDLPYTNDEAIGFYKAESKYHYSKINHDLRVHRDSNDMNTVERYFETFVK